MPRTYKRAPTQPDGTGIIERKEDKTELVSEEYELETINEEIELLEQAVTQYRDRLAVLRADRRAIEAL